MAKFLISGATGKQGGAVIDRLLSDSSDQSVKFVALVRNPEASAAEALKKKGVSLARGSLTDEASLVQAMQGVTSAYLVTTPHGKEGAQVEVTQGKTFIDAARKAGVKHIVFSSIEGAERKTGIPHFESKFEVEEYLRASGIPFTIIRPTGFYENFTPQGGLMTAMMLGMFEAALKGKKMLMVSTQDIASFAARALLDPSNYSGRIIPLAGDSLTITEIQEAYRKVNGQCQVKAPLPGFTVNLLPNDLKLMVKWLYTDGCKADIPALRAEHPGLLNFEQYIRDGQSSL